MLDKTKSYGTIVGHAWARYEQGGTLYDGAGKSYAEQSSDREEIIEEGGYHDPQASSENAREFLTRILSEGPMNRDVIVQMADQQGLNWQFVKDAAIEMKINSYKIRENNFWRMPIE